MTLPLIKKVEKKKSGFWKPALYSIAFIIVGIILIFTGGLRFFTIHH
jgi:hypothetical protein